MRLVISVIVVTCANCCADDWPQWLGPQRDGVWRENGLLDRFGPQGPPRVWSTKVGAGYSGPAVANSRVYLSDRTTIDAAPTQKGAFDRTEQKGAERNFCVDQKTGQPIWSHSYPVTYRISYAAGPRCTPTVDGDRVYFLGAMGDLMCHDAETGTIRWSKNFVTDYESSVPVWGFAAHPLIEGDLLICLAGGTKGRLVVALDKRTGHERWTSLSFESGDWGYAPPVIYEFGGTRQLIIWHPKAVVGLDPTTGRKLWDVPFEVKAALTVPMPRKIDDYLFLTSFYNGSMLLRVSSNRAEIVWKSQAKGERPHQTTDLSSIMPTPIVRDGIVYGISSYGELTAVELMTGKRLWQTMVATRGPLTPSRVRDNPEPSTTQPWAERWANAFLIENEERTVLFNEQGELILAQLRPTGYNEISRHQILKPTNRLAGRPVVWSHPAFADRCVFARNDEELICVSLAK